MIGVGRMLLLMGACRELRNSSHQRAIVLQCTAQPLSGVSTTLVLWLCNRQFEPKYRLGTSRSSYCARVGSVGGRGRPPAVVGLSDWAIHMLTIAGTNLGHNGFKQLVETARKQLYVRVLDVFGDGVSYIKVVQVVAWLALQVAC